MSCAWEVCVGVLSASPPVLPGKTGIASGSSLSDVPDMDCSSSAIDDLIKEVRPHLGCRRSAGSGWLIKNSLCLPKIPSAELRGWICSSFRGASTRTRLWCWLLLSMCIQLGENSLGDGVCPSSVPLLGLLTPGCFPSVALEGFIQIYNLGNAKLDLSNPKNWLALPFGPSPSAARHPTCSDPGFWYPTALLCG